MKYILIIVTLVWLGVTNSPPNIELPNDVQIRTLQPGELRVSGMTPVISDYGDWYDGCNYTASPQWNAEHGKNTGNMWTSTCMGCTSSIDLADASIQVDSILAATTLTGYAEYTPGRAKTPDEIEKANSP